MTNFQPPAAEQAIAAEQAKRWAKVLKVLAAAIAVIVVGLMLNGYREELRSRTEIKRAYEQALSESDKDMADKVAYLRSIGLIGEPVATSKTDVCWIDHSDAGWMVQSYHQNCYLVTIHGFEKPRKGVRLPTELNDGWRKGSGRCELLEMQSGFESEVTNCEVPEPLDTSWVTGYAAGDARTKLVSQTGDWDGSKGSVIWVKDFTRYLNEDLGCSRINPVFCNSPRSEPITAS